MTGIGFQEDLATVPGDPLFDEISRINNELINIRRQLAKKNLELERLNEEKNRFLGMAAHDLRNPLNAILSFSDFLIDEASDKLEQEQVEFLQVIRSSSNFMVELVDDLLDVAKIESGKLHLDLQPVDIKAILEHSISLNRILAGRKHITFELVSQDQLPTIMVDPVKIEQVFDNLLSNGVKYSQPGSAVQVKVMVENDVITISVRDQGEGIPRNEIEKLFKPFSQTSVKSTAGEKSSGLGLAIARRIVEGHQGRIWVESAVGQGSTFYVTIPIHEME